MMPNKAQVLRFFGFWKRNCWKLWFPGIALVVLYQYAPVLQGDFPLEPETGFFFGSFHGTPWHKVPMFQMYYSLFPVVNCIQKISVELFYFSHRALYGVMLAIHLLNILLVFLITRKLWRRIAPAECGDTERAANWAGVLASIAFGTFNSYYHCLANPSVMCGVGVVYAVILLYAFLVLVILGSDKKMPWLYGMCVVIAGILPFMFMTSISFLAITVVLFVCVGSDWRKKAWLVVPLIAVNLAALFVEVGFLDARFSRGTVAATSGWNPHSFGLLPNIVRDPATFGMTVLHTAFGGVQFGLVHQNLLFSTTPYSFPYLAGFSFLVMYLALALGHARIARINILLWLIVFVNLVNICIMRNPLSGESGRMFDAYWVASMPRYYYFPAAVMAVSVGLSSGWLLTLLPKRRVLFGLCVVLILAFAASNAMFSREKIDYLKQHMSSEVFKYTPNSLKLNPWP